MTPEEREYRKRTRRYFLDEMTDDDRCMVKALLDARDAPFADLYELTNEYEDDILKSAMDTEAVTIRERKILTAAVWRLRTHLPAEVVIMAALKGAATGEVRQDPDR